MNDNHMEGCDKFHKCTCEAIEIKTLKERLKHFEFNDRQGAEELDSLQSKLAEVDQERKNALLELTVYKLKLENAEKENERLNIVLNLMRHYVNHTPFATRTDYEKWNRKAVKLINKHFDENGGRLETDFFTDELLNPKETE